MFASENSQSLATNTRNSTNLYPESGFVHEYIASLENLSELNEEQTLLLCKAYIQAGEEKKCISLCDKRMRSGQSSDELILEKLLAQGLQEGRFENIYHRFGFHEQDREEETILKIANLLRERYRLRQAALLLHKHLYDYSNNPLYKSTFDEVNQNLYLDFYYRYYGYFIMFLQVLTTGIVLFFALYYFEHSLFSGFSFISCLFTIFALSPVFYVNCRMIHDRFFKKENCFTEVYNEFIKVSHHGDLYFLRKDPETLRLYKDDNDYSYISWIRHLPFVPNFTYIRAWNCQSNTFSTLPLYGVADGEIFESIYFEKEVRGLNMIGVRLGQIEDFFDENSLFLRILAAPPFGIGLALLVCSLFDPKLMNQFYLNAVQNLQAGTFTFLEPTRELVFFTSLNFYIVSEPVLYLCIALAGFTAFFSRTIARVILRSSFSFPVFGQLLELRIVRSGILLLAALAFVQHYYHYPAWLIPVLCLTLLFYQVFVRTRFKAEQKQVVAGACSVFKNPDKEQLYLDHFGLKKITLEPNSYSAYGPLPTFFVHEKFLVFPNLYWGFNLRFFVLSLEKDTPLKVEEVKKGTLLHFQGREVLLKIRTQEFLYTMQLHGVKCERYDRPEGIQWRNILGRLLVVYLGSTLVLGFGLDEKAFQGLFILGLYGSLIGIPAILCIRKPYYLTISVFFCWQLYDAFQVDYAEKNARHYYDLAHFRERCSPNYEMINLEEAYFLQKGGILTLHLQEDQITYGEYEENLNRWSDLNFEEIPPFIAHQRPREESLQIIQWHIFTKDQRFDARRYGRAAREYCAKRGLGLIDSRARCGAQIKYDLRQANADEVLSDLIAFGEQELLKKLPKAFLDKIIENAPHVWFRLNPKVPMHAWGRSYRSSLEQARLWALLLLQKRPELYGLLPQEEFRDNFEFNLNFLASYISKNSAQQILNDGVCRLPAVQGIFSSSARNLSLPSDHPAYLYKDRLLACLYPQEYEELRETPERIELFLYPKITSLEPRFPAIDSELKDLSKSQIERMIGTAEWVIDRTKKLIKEGGPRTTKNLVELLKRNQKELKLYYRDYPQRFLFLPEAAQKLIPEVAQIAVQEDPQTYHKLSEELRDHPDILFRAFPLAEALKSQIKTKKESYRTSQYMSYKPRLYSTKSGQEISKYTDNDLKWVELRLKLLAEYFEKEAESRWQEGNLASLHARAIKKDFLQLSIDRFLKKLASRHQVLDSKSKTWGVEKTQMGLSFAQFLLKQFPHLDEDSSFPYAGHEKLIPGNL